MSKSIYKSFSLYKSHILSDEKSKKLIFQSDGRNHYVYRITNKNKCKHYYGSRATKLEPVDDIGIKYFSSSSNKEFLTEQKQNPDNFKYKIIKIFDNPGDNILFESYLHQYFQVSSHDKFINKSIQLPFGWNTTNNVLIIDKINKTMAAVDPETGLSIRDTSKIKFRRTINKINPTSGLTRAQEIGIKSKKSNSKIDPVTGMSGYQRSQIAAKITLNEVNNETGLTRREEILAARNIINPETGLSINSLVGIKVKGKNNAKFSGYYITPNGIFESSGDAAKYLSMSSSCIRSYCKNPNRLITLDHLRRSKYLKSLKNSEILKLTFGDLGFSFKTI